MSSSSSPPSSSRSVSKISSSGSSSCRVEVISSSSADSSPADSKGFTALQSLLGPIRDCYSIPEDYELHAPRPGQRPYDMFPNGFGLTMDALEAGLRFSLHPVVRECLRWWGISPSQIAPNSWRYLGRGGHYLTAQRGFRISGAPSNN
ncbi:unnamed protein product [Musa banksii]